MARRARPAAKHEKRRRPAREPEPARDEAPPGPRPYWSGTISFGLVSVPVNLYPAVRATRIPMRLLAADGTPLRRRYFCPEHDRDVENDELVRGYEVDEGQHVVVSDEELEAVAPRKSRDIDLRRFVDLDQLDPLLFESAFVLTPAGDTTKPYRLLAEAMERERKAGIATAVIRNQEHLVAILAERGILHAETLRFVDELRTPESVGTLERVDPPRARVADFAEAIERRSKARIDEGELADAREERLRALVERKHARSEDVVESHEAEPEEDPESDEITGGEDLFDVIRRSLEGTRAGSGARARRARGRPDAAPRAKVRRPERASDSTARNPQSANPRSAGMRSGSARSRGSNSNSNSNSDSSSSSKGSRAAKRPESGRTGPRRRAR